MTGKFAAEAWRADPFSKDRPAADNSIAKGHSLANPDAAPSSDSADVPGGTPRLERIYADRARFVWLSLQRLGVARADLDDVCHDVFLVIQKRLPEFERGARLSPWLFGICARVAANYRRRAYRRYESSGGSMSEDEAHLAAPAAATPERVAQSRQAMAAAEGILASMGPVKRAVFVMFELEGLGCPEIASELELPVGTVYSRLHAARKLFQAKAARALSDGKRGGGRD